MLPSLQDLEAEVARARDQTVTLRKLEHQLQHEQQQQQQLLLQQEREFQKQLEQALQEKEQSLMKKLAGVRRSSCTFVSHMDIHKP